VDQIRALRFDAKRAAKKQRLQDDPTMQAHRRLRLARRLAGYVSTTDAAAETGLKRTTLSAHETGQNSISQKMARLYGQAFGVSPAWLLTGETPSGYPLETERRLPHLVNSFDEADREAREALADWIKPVKRQIETITEPPASKVQFEKNQTETVPEISGRNVFRCIEEGSFSEIFSEQAWSFPKGYLAEVLGAASPSVVIISPSVDLALPHRGERLIVDTSARVRLPDRLYVWVNKIGRFWTNDGSEVDADWLMVGWVCGRIGRT
jgi:transcriptional regulator with XRE-family HTH domain